MSDEILEVGAKVDVSGVAAAMSTAAGDVADATQSMGQNFDKLAEATRKAIFEQTNLRGVVRQLVANEIPGEKLQVAALSDALQRNAAAQAEVVAIKKQAVQATKDAVQAEAAAVAAAKAEQAAQEAAAAAAKQAAEAHLMNAVALKEEAAAGEVAVGSHTNLTNATRATSGAIMEFEGKLPIRAVERFAVTTLGLGPIMEAAFPIIGAIAAGEVLFKLAGEVVNVYNEWFNYTREVEAARKAEEELDRQFEASINVSDRLNEKIAELRAGRLALADAGYKPGMAPTAKQMQQESTGERAGGLNYKVAQDENTIAILNKQLVDAIVKADHLRTLVSSDTLYGDKDKAKALLPAAENRVTTVTQQLQTAQQQQGVDIAELQKEKLKEASEAQAAAATAAREATAQARQAAAAQRAAEQEAFRGWQETLVERKLQEGAFHEDSKREDMLYWKGILDNNTLSVSQRREVEKLYLAAKNEAARESLGNWVASKKEEVAEQEKTSQEIVTLYQKIQEAMVDAYGAGSKQAIDAQKDVVKAIREVEAAEDAAQRKRENDRAKQRRPAEMEQTGIAANAGGKAAETQRFASQELAVHIISQRQYETAVQESENNVYAIKLAALQKRRALEALDPNSAEETQRTDNEIAKLTQDHETKITQLQQQQILTRAKAIDGYFHQMSGGFTSALGSWERGQGGLLQGFEKTLGSMAISLQGHLLDMGAQWAEHYAMQKILHIGTAATKASVDATAKGTAVTTNALANVSIILSDAAVASAAAFASTAAIPIVGPLLAPEAAGAAYATVAAMSPLASARGGWDMVPSDDTLTNLHKNEMVLPEDLAGRVRKMTAGSSVTNNFGGNTFHGHGSDDFPALLDQHEDALAYKMSSLMRDGKMGG